MADDENTHEIPEINLDEARNYRASDLKPAARPGKYRPPTAESFLAEAEAQRPDPDLIDFGQLIHHQGRPPAPLGQIVSEAIDGYAQVRAMSQAGPLPPSHVVALGGFALAVRAGGKQRIGSQIDRRILASACSGLFPTVAVQVLEALRLTHLAETMTS